MHGILQQILAGQELLLPEVIILRVYVLLIVIQVYMLMADNKDVSIATILNSNKINRIIKCNKYRNSS